MRGRDNALVKKFVWGTQPVNQQFLPQALVGHQAAGLGHMLLQKLVQVAEAVRVVLHDADGLVPQTGPHQAGHVWITEPRQLLGLAAELLAQMIGGSRAQGGHRHKGGTVDGTEESVYLDLDETEGEQASGTLGETALKKKPQTDKFNG